MNWLSELFKSRWQGNIETSLATITTMLLTQTKEIKKMSELTDKFAEELQEVADNVAANTSVTASVAEVIQELVTKQAELIQEVKDAQAANDPVAILAALNALDAQNEALKANTAKLAEAVVAGTPVGPPVE